MAPEDSDDAALLRAHAAGDPQAFARLYDRYDRAGFIFIRRLLGAAHGEAAEDLHQETWIAVARSAKAYDPAKASFPAWFFTIARRKVWDYFRSQKVAVLARAPEDAAIQIADPGVSPLDHVASRQSARQVLDALDALPVEQRSALVLFTQGGLSLDEIGEVTGVGAETVKSRLRYARAKLHQVLAGTRPGERTADV